MTDNVIYGVDFKRAPVSVVCLGPLLTGRLVFTDADGNISTYDQSADTAPSEYVLPADDCA